ncbi:MAG: glycosyltransferase family 2 protein [Acidimicrobiales bacterium]|nr:glycosyltransferase family 2 protein [Acidimicrobiales bacterium]
MNQHPDATTAEDHGGDVVDLTDSSERREVADLTSQGMSLSIVMPAHNEEATIDRAVRRVLAASVRCPFELIVVDDGSTDETAARLERIRDSRVRVVNQKVNLGKGAAVRTGAAAARGTHILVFDADLEYDPDDIDILVGEVIEHDMTVVYGTRLFGQNTVYGSFRYAMGNRATTFAANCLFDSYISDLHTCLKLLPTDLFRSLHLTENGFGLDTEITAELLRRGFRPFEVPVRYVGRSRAEGKKITWRDGVECLSILAKVRMRRHRTSTVERSCGNRFVVTAGPVGNVDRDVAVSVLA